MASTKKSTTTIPFTIEIGDSLVKKLDTFQKKAKLRNRSEAVRYALVSYDPSKYVGSHEKQHQISVRIMPETRDFLGKAAKTNKISMGVLVRAALEALDATSSPDDTVMTRIGLNRAPADKVSTATKKTSRKVAMKKTATKKSARKAAAKKSTAKKVTAKKAARKSSRKK